MPCRHVVRARRAGRRFGKQHAGDLVPTGHGNDDLTDNAAANDDDNGRVRADRIDDVDGAGDHSTDAHHRGCRC